MQYNYNYIDIIFNIKILQNSTKIHNKIILFQKHILLIISKKIYLIHLSNIIFTFTSILIISIINFFNRNRSLSI